MASDILFCDTDLVPVGIDQKQHVELARNIAERFNKTYGETFKIPEPLITKVGTKIKDLKDPSKKMSKSEENPVGVISLFDDIETAKKKIMKSTTDSLNEVKFDEENQPGISNLLNIASALSHTEIKEIEEKFKDKGYGEFKKYVAEIVGNFLENIQGKYNKILNSNMLDEILDKGKEKTRLLAKEKYEQVKEKVGVTRKNIKEM